MEFTTMSAVFAISFVAAAIRKLKIKGEN